MNRDREWDFIDEAHHKLSDDNRSLLATFALVVKELAIKCPNNQGTRCRSKTINTRLQTKYEY